MVNVIMINMSGITNMKIAIYGVSRSGKDYLLEQVVEHLNIQGISAFHLKGSTTINELSKNKYGLPLKEIDEEKRIILRKVFIDIVEEISLDYDVVLVDGHYAFIDGESFKTVFTDADKYCYDHFFYLDTLTEKIVEFSRKQPKQPQDLTIQEYEINAWKDFEIKRLNSVCNELGKELVILDDDTQDCIQFLTHWIIEPNRFYYPEIANRLVSDFLGSNDKKYSTVILLDCDNTLSENDATYDFCDFLNIENSKLKQIFMGDRYSSYQFFRMQNLYKCFDDEQLEKAIKYAAARIKISNKILMFTKRKYDNAYVCALTSGVWGIWQSKIDELGNIDKIWGNLVGKMQRFFITPLLKKYIALSFKKYGVEVIAIGDSAIDIPMLESADQGYIVAHKKLNLAVNKYFLENPHSQIKQVFATQWYYPIEQIFYEEN